MFCADGQPKPAKQQATAGKNLCFDASQLKIVVLDLTVLQSYRFPFGY
jgi:hypothetical protein